MSASPPSRPNRGRPLDNEPTPLLTYGDDDHESAADGRGRRRRRAWPWILIVMLALAGGAYYFALESDLGFMPAGTTEVPPERLPPLQAMSGEATLRPAVPTDTTVAPGTPVELSVRATAASGSMVPDVRVRFVIDRGGGTLTSAEVWTDPGGIARTTLVTPSQPANVVVRASLDGPDAPATHFTIVTRAGAAATMTAIQGDGQQEDAGALLPERLGVRVTDADGAPVPGVEVRFQVGAGGGQSAPSVARTDSLGQASAVWRLGPASGAQMLTAVSPELGGSVTFTAIARGTAAPPATGPAVETPAPTPAPAPPTASPPISVPRRDLAVGGSSVCFLSGSTVTCQGANDRGQGIRDGAPGAASLAAGLFHACALNASGIASCWGANDAGQLGDRTRTDRSTAVTVATDFRFSVLAAGLAHTCGLTEDGRAACWGQNLGGQLGDGSRDDRMTPVLVADGVPFVDLVSGWNHTCGLTGSRELYCWGLNRGGAVGDGSQLDRLVPQRVAAAVGAVAAGSAHTCAIVGGRVLCWGDNSNGQLGDGTTTSRVRPTPVAELPGTPVGLAAGAAHTCALLSDGSAHCWGQNLHGQLGNASTNGTAFPSPVVGGRAYVRLSAGGGVTCGVTAGGERYCWGLNQSGQLGDGTFTNRAIPARVPGG